MSPTTLDTARRLTRTTGIQPFCVCMETVPDPESREPGEVPERYDIGRQLVTGCG